MPEPVIFVRGFPPFFGQDPSTNTELVEDLKAIARLSDGQVGELRQRLAQTEGFLSRKALLETIRGSIGDAKTAEAVRRALRHGQSGVEQIIRRLEEGQEEEEFPFEPATISRLKHVLSELIQPYPALTRLQKAERLAVTTGQQLEGIELICDLRPVFDENRAHLEGMMPYTRLHVVATGDDGLPKSFEAELTHQQVIDLVEKAQKAKTKLDVLGQCVETWLPGGLPDVPLTQISRKVTTDDR